MDKDDKTHIDPVCGMDVDEDQAAGNSRHEGQKYYFCSDECKRTFDADPAEYAISIVPKM